jgi:protein phosphatase
VIPVEQSHLEVAVLSHVGLKRLDNEDRFAISTHEVSDKDPTRSLLAIVADGVGGHRAGEVAAQVAVETIQETVARSDARQPVLTLQEAFVAANQAINALANTNRAYHGMSTTAVCAWVIGERLFIASVGDSRAYLHRAGSIQQLSTDHTWVQEAIDSGLLTFEEARSHPNAHVIRRHLGSLDGVIPDLRLNLAREEIGGGVVSNQGMQLLPGDGLLLCSDGLTDLVEDNEILAAFQGSSLDEALASLVELANSRGGHDNITLVALRAPAARRSDPVRRPLQAKVLSLIFFAAIFVLLVGAVFSGIMLFRKERTLPTATFTQRAAPLLLPSIVPTAFPPLEVAGTPSLAPGSGLPTPGITEELVGDQVLPPIQATQTAWPTSTPDS